MLCQKSSSSLMNSRSASDRWERYRRADHSVGTEGSIGFHDSLAGVIDLITMQAIYYDGEKGEDVRFGEIPADHLEKAKEWREKLIESLADVDDVIGNKFLEGQEPTQEEIYKAVRTATLSHKLVPIMTGSAYKNKGVQTLLDGIIKYLPNPSERDNIALDVEKNEEKVHLKSEANLPFVGLAFKLDDGRYGQLTYTRIYQDCTVNKVTGLLL